MANIKNMTYRGHNWICASPPHMALNATFSLTRVTLLTDKEYNDKRFDKDRKKWYRRLKETDRELVEFSFGPETPEVEKVKPIKA